MNKQLYYDDVSLIAKYYDGDSRTGNDTSVRLGDYTFKLPVIPANMKCTIDMETAERLSKAGYFYILHRFYTNDEIFDWVKSVNNSDIECISISVGVGEVDKELVTRLANEKLVPEFITVDIAHGHSRGMKEMIEFIRSKMDDVFIIAGNVMTREAVDDLSSWGADAVKVGIGGGRVCSTKLKTGFTKPMFSCVLDCCTVNVDENELEKECSKEVLDEYKLVVDNGRNTSYPHSHRFPDKFKWIQPLFNRHFGDIKNITSDEIHNFLSIEMTRRFNERIKNTVVIIADGGIRENGDIAKALVAGADMAMAGSMFAGCEDSPAESVFNDDLELVSKRYYGSASEENKGHNRNVEGFLIEIPYNGFTYQEKLDEIKMDLQSSISYGGGNNLSCLPKVEWKIVQ